MHTFSDLLIRIGSESGTLESGNRAIPANLVIGEFRNRGSLCVGDFNESGKVSGLGRSHMALDLAFVGHGE